MVHNPEPCGFGGCANEPYSLMTLPHYFPAHRDTHTLLLSRVQGTQKGDLAAEART